MWEATLEACGISGEIPGGARGGYNRAVADLKGVGASPEQVRVRAARFRQKWPTMSLTPTALARHWAELDGAPRLEEWE